MKLLRMRFDVEWRQGAGVRTMKKALSEAWKEASDYYPEISPTLRCLKWLMPVS